MRQRKRLHTTRRGAAAVLRDGHHTWDDFGLPSAALTNEMRADAILYYKVIGQR